MKKVTILLTLLSVTIMSYSQSVTAGITYSTSKDNILSADVFYKAQNNIVLGVGGGHILSAYTGESKVYNDFLPFKEKAVEADRYKSFIENQGTVKGLLGYAFKNTIIATDLGIGFRFKYNLYAGQDPNLQNPLIIEGKTFYFTYDHISPVFLYGVVIQQTMFGRWGLIAGYNNVEKVRVGVSLKLTPTKMFNW